MKNIEEDYATQKLKFVSNLNGTTLNEIVSLLTLFPLINFLSVLLKMFLLFCVNAELIEKLNKIVEKPSDKVKAKNNYLFTYFW
jgi:hypothetical protein